MRAALAVCLVVVGCGGNETPAPNGGDVAGTVLAVEGEASARRGATDAPARPLHVKDPVFADDTVTTSAAGSLRILLTHNQVVWTLEAGQSRRVDATAAWRAPKGTGGGEPVIDDRTASAGRHAEQEAAGTAATAAPPPPEARAPEAPVTKQEEASKAKASAPEPTKAEPPRRPAPAKAAPKREPEGDAYLAAPEGGQGLGRGAGAADKGAAPGGGGESLRSEDVRRVVSMNMAQLRACYAEALKQDPAAEARVVLTFTVGAGGKITAAATDPDRGELTKCIVAKVKRWQFPAGGGSGAVRVPLVLRAD